MKLGYADVNNVFAKTAGSHTQLCPAKSLEGELLSLTKTLHPYQHLGWRPLLIIRLEGPLLVGWKPLLGGWRPSLVAWKPLLVGWRSSPVD